MVVLDKFLIIGVLATSALNASTRVRACRLPAGSEARRPWL